MYQGLVGGGTDQGYPRYVWFFDKGDVIYYEARLSNAGDGSYKGYPLNDDEVPPELRKVLNA